MRYTNRRLPLSLPCLHFGPLSIEVKVEISIAPYRKKLTSEALRCGSQSFYTANTSYLSSPRKHSQDGATTD